MKDESKGWVVINENHPNTKSKYVIPGTFAGTKKAAIANFIEGSGDSWEYWQTKFNFQCVRARRTVETIQ